MTNKEAENLIKELFYLKSFQGRSLEDFLNLTIQNISKSQLREITKISFTIIEDPLIEEKFKKYAKNLLLELIENESKNEPTPPPSSWIS